MVAVLLGVMYLRCISSSVRNIRHPHVFLNSLVTLFPRIYPTGSISKQVAWFMATEPDFGILSALLKSNLERSVFNASRRVEMVQSAHAGKDYIMLVNSYPIPGALGI